MNSDDLALSKVKASLLAQEKRLARGERQRARFWVSQFGLWLAVLGLFGVAAYYFFSVRVDTSRARERQIQQLACLLVRDTPPGDDLGDRIRVRYDCPAYHQPSARPTESPTSSAVPRPDESSQQARTRPEPASSPTRTSPAPARAAATATPARIPSSTQQPTPRPSTTPRAPAPVTSTRPAPLLPIPGCTISLLTIHVC